jgi:hypothetical protein
LRSFAYPISWRTLAVDFTELGASRTFGVLGTGARHTGCRVIDNGGDCTGDVVDISGGRIVVKVYERVGGPPPWCAGATHADATLGPNAVSKQVDASSTIWEIRRPGAEFFWPGNAFVEAWTDSTALLAQAEALVASFRWRRGVISSGTCAPIDTPAPDPS